LVRFNLEDTTGAGGGIALESLAVGLKVIPVLAERREPDARSDVAVLQGGGYPVAIGRLVHAADQPAIGVSLDDQDHQRGVHAG
jgi:hypothetical protein